MTKSGQLVCSYLENIPREGLEKYQKIIREYAKGRHGIYALYKSGKLYYVGLASNLRSRLHHHLQDRHAQSWDRFSIYLTINDRQLKDLETLVLRIASPKGNLQEGKFIQSEDLKRKFRRQFTEFQRHERDIFFQDNHPTFEPDQQPEPIKGRKATLADYIKRLIHIRFEYKGHLYIAHVRRDGTITFAAEGHRAKELQGKVYTSPSLAATAITNHKMNGWKAWKYERSPGEWVLLDELRKQ